MQCMKLEVYLRAAFVCMCVRFFYFANKSTHNYKFRAQHFITDFDQENETAKFNTSILSMHKLIIIRLTELS